jgi:hypothetical protein
MAGAVSQCCNCGCVDDGQFVYASRTIEGWRGVGWHPAGVPLVLERIFLKTTITHTKYVYEDIGGTWTLVATRWFKFTIIRSPDCNQEIYFKAEGELNGTVEEWYTCPEPYSFVKHWDDWVTDAYGDDLPPYPGFYPAGDTNTNIFLSASEASVLFRYEAKSGGQTIFKLDTQIDMEDEFDTDDIRGLVADMLASVPLTRGTPAAFSGINVDGDPVSGTFGFSSKGAEFNHATVLWNYDCCDGAVVKIPHVALRDDDKCRCSETWEGSEYTVRVLYDRKQTYNPAKWAVSIPGAPGGGVGYFYTTGVDGPETVYGYKARWIGAGAPFTWDAEGDPNVLSTYEASASGKKSLLARNDPDDWTVLKAVASDGTITETCLLEELPPPVDPEARCYRFYYPDGADSAVESSSQAVFIISGTNGDIYREIPLLTIEMEDDCPVPPPGEPDCPTGDDGSDVLVDPNPCLEEEESPMAAATMETPAPAKPWPAWAQELAQHRAPGDRGVGDTAEHVHGLMGSETFLAWYRGQFGKRPCAKCPAKWNRQYPYSRAA